MISIRCWRAVAVLVAFQAAIVALAMVGLARADERAGWRRVGVVRGLVVLRAPDLEVARV